MHSTRQVILETLSTLGRATVSDLEQRVGVKAITVRHHLTALQAEGLVDAEPIRRPVGRPQMAYFLTDRAYNLLPHRYQTLVERLLDQIKATHSPDMVQALIGSLADSLAQELDHQIAHLPPGERRQRLIEVLNDEGFVARWQRGGDGIKLVEYHCPYYLVGQRHPEVCQIGEALIRTAVGGPVEKEACLLAGDTVCAFAIVEGNELSQ